MNAIVRALTEKEATTSAGAHHPELCGRTYSIRFEDVWQASLGVIRTQRGWGVVLADDREGRINGLATSLLRGVETELIVKIGLDSNGQTRVDVTARTRTERRDWGRSRRVVIRFIRKLDRALEAKPAQILNPALLPRLQESA